MSDELRQLVADFESPEELLTTLLMAEAMTPRGRPGPLARPWAASGSRSKTRGERQGAQREEGRRRG